MRLDKRLIEKKTTDGRIDFHEYISRVREEASNWLDSNEKNGVEHSRKLEGYLYQFIPDKFKKKLRPAEIFILLYAVYLQDIGYRNEQGEIESSDHPLQNKNYILKDPIKYLVDRFSSMKKREAPLAAQAVGEGYYGHAYESVCPFGISQIISTCAIGNTALSCQLKFNFFPQATSYVLYFFSKILLWPKRQNLPLPNSYRCVSDARKQ
ncbi:MAG: hypothetical protein LWW97_06485 [Deltaproteobacteria bacterium]|nr:hypothetical protein [Deltaproteobacteria bacterium]